jgi:hypothetical protein
MKKLKFISVFTVSALFIGMSFTSCKATEPDPDEGKTDPSTIATSNLVAYFPFNGNATEAIGTLNPVVQPNVTYVTGRRGQAYQGATGAHLRYTLPAASKLKNLTSFSVALWFRSPLVTGDPEPIFFQIGKSDDLFWGNLTLALNRLSATADSLKFKIFFLKTGVEWNGQHMDFSKNTVKINNWMHIVIQYDAATSKVKIFKDGVQIVTSEGFEDRKSGPAGGALGALAFANADVINIGAWRPKTEGTATDAWMGWFMGNLDELRVYDKALTSTEVKALYDAEVTQVN